MIDLTVLFIAGLWAYISFKIERTTAWTPLRLLLMLGSIVITFLMLKIDIAQQPSDISLLFRSVLIVMLLSVLYVTIMFIISIIKTHGEKLYDKKR